MTEPSPIVFDLGAAARLVARRWRRVAAGVGLGLVTAAAVLLFWRPSFDGRALLLIREFPGTAGSLPSKSSIVSQLVPGLLGDQGDEELATELALLQSRAAVGAVVDSLRLEVQPREPGRTPPALLVDSVKLPNRFKPLKLTLRTGANVIPEGVIYASQAGNGAYVKLVDREDAITDLADRLSVEKAGGDAVEI
ncbi:MAG TPA: hypothetical protein VG818_12310, partial [Gemmatimonadaceae bacterium]|nr:hypothetical protein [Gemmatimonadaceae bacterium]